MLIKTTVINNVKLQTTKTKPEENKSTKKTLKS